MNQPKSSPPLAVSTWSLHHSLSARADDADASHASTGKAGRISLLDIPAQAAAHGIGKIEICHFHFPSTDAAYLSELKSSLAGAGVQAWTLLIDTGDLTHPDEPTRLAHVKTIGGWIDVAGELGAARVRVIAGQAAPDSGGEMLRRSIGHFRELARRASDQGVRVVTENWYALLDRPAEVLQLLETLGGEVGLLLDFGNWSAERKYADLAQIAPFAESTHAKANYGAGGELDQADFARCLHICAEAGFDGPHSLIYDGGGDEWAEIAKLRDFIREAS